MKMTSQTIGAFIAKYPEAAIALPQWAASDTTMAPHFLSDCNDLLTTLADQPTPQQLMQQLGNPVTAAEAAEVARFILSCGIEWQAGRRVGHVLYGVSWGVTRWCLVFAGARSLSRVGGGDAESLAAVGVRDADAVVRGVAGGVAKTLSLGFRWRCLWRCRRRPRQRRR